VHDVQNQLEAEFAGDVIDAFIGPLPVELAALGFKEAPRQAIPS